MATGDKKAVLMEEQKGKPLGVAGLGADGKLAQMPELSDLGVTHTAPQVDDAVSRALPGGAIETALSNKMDVIRGFSALGPAYNVQTPIDTIVAAIPDNTVFVADVVVTAGSVYPAIYGVLVINKVRANRVSLDFTSNEAVGSTTYNRRWIGQSNSGAFGGWCIIPTAAPPEWILAPLATGWTHFNTADGLKCGRDGSGHGWIRGGVYPTSLSVGVACCTLPPGYRPNTQQWVDTVSSAGVARTFRISTEGNVALLYGPTTLQPGEGILFKTASWPLAT